MAPVVRVEPNGLHAFLSHDDFMDDLVAYGWDVSIKQFEGFNLTVAQFFAQYFDGTKAKVGDFQLEVSEFSTAEATGLSQEGDLWFKNTKIEAVP
jgi:hypothetical protein